MFDIWLQFPDHKMLETHERYLRIFSLTQGFFKFYLMHSIKLSRQDLEILFYITDRKIFIMTVNLSLSLSLSLYIYIYII